MFLTRPGTEPTAEDLEAVENLRQAFAAHFFAMTRGVAFVDTSLAETPRPPRSGPPDLDRAQSWLLAQQRLDGSWADASSTAVRDTATAVEALAQSVPGSPAIARGLAWLAGAEPRSTDFAARQGLVLGPGSADRSRRAGDLLARQTADGGFGAGNDYSSDPLDTALVLRALKALGHPPDTAARRALLALGALRAAGGGWPVVPGGEPSTLITAHVVLALQDWKDVAGGPGRARAGPGQPALAAQPGRRLRREPQHALRQRHCPPGAAQGRGSGRDRGRARWPG